MRGTTPDLPPVDQTPHLTLIGPSPDDHVISRVFWSIKGSVWRGKIQIVSSVIADDLLYHFSDEDNDEDALLNRVFDR